MLPQTRAALDYLDTLLAVGDESAKELATVLAALRGPDHIGDAHLKDLTTARIRAVAFPRTCHRSLVRGYVIDTQWRVNLDGERITGPILDGARSVHFTGHVRSAAKLLDMWGS